MMVWEIGGSYFTVTFSGRTGTENILPMGLFLNPVFIREGCHGLSCGHVGCGLAGCHALPEAVPARFLIRNPI
jgi:hypothetical protein